MTSSTVTYHGCRSRDGALTVWRVEQSAYVVRARALPDMREIHDMGARGFDAGRASRGAAQLALALLADRADGHTARKLCALYWRAKVRTLPRGAWSLPAAEVDAWIRRQRWLRQQTGGAA